MGRKEKSKATARDHEQLDEISDNLDGASTPSLVFSGDDDDDDEEANQDLSLKIVEKALRTREAKLAPNDAGLNGIGSQQSEFTVTQNDDVLGGMNGITDLEVMKEKKMENLMVESGNQSVCFRI
ncbi:zinc finger CCHC domain-containing protein 7-like [Trifolium medium]|uniref:Zinc finger CCHC domain-containing protein 7-like n=1 Tax=Trifolium medium TaxID=97028 RepID=A0A392NI93_9FABA|nr:zinc finger CCHC domain-containing protein 7-like [Trifolium medium]